MHAGQIIIINIHFKYFRIFIQFIFVLLGIISVRKLGVDLCMFSGSGHTINYAKFIPPIQSQNKSMCTNHDKVQKSEVDSHPCVIN